MPYVSRPCLTGYFDFSFGTLRPRITWSGQDGDGRICEEEVGAALTSMAVSGEEAVQAGSLTQFRDSAETRPQEVQRATGQVTA